MTPPPPISVSAGLLQALAAVSPGGGAEHRVRLAQSVRELSALFTRQRDQLEENYLDHAERLQAYLHYYLPVNYAKVRALLEELPVRRAVAERVRPLRVWDIGAGPGTATMAVLDWLIQRGWVQDGVEITAFDRSRKALGLATQLWGAARQWYAVPDAIFQTRTVDCERLSEWQRVTSTAGKPVDLIVLANTLNEWFRNDRDPVGRRAKIVAHLLSVMDVHGALVVVEPALREPTRSLHALRDRLIEQNLARVYSPCLHDAPCPALRHADDWCHEERQWEAPVHIAEVDREVGFIKDALKFSYVIMRRDGQTIEPRASSLIRIVSEPRAFKGELRMFGCGETGRRDFGRLEKDRSPSNEVWDRCQRGTIVRITGTEPKEEAKLARIPANATVEIVRAS